MKGWERLLRDLRIRPPSVAPIYVPGDLLLALQIRAEQEQRGAVELADELLGNALVSRKAVDGQILIWEALTDRQQEITAMLCLNYSNPKIARRLGISINAVKGHVKRVLEQFGVHDRAELRQHLAHWDFSAWPGWSTPAVPEINVEDEISA